MNNFKQLTSELMEKKYQGFKDELDKIGIGKFSLENMENLIIDYQGVKLLKQIATIRITLQKELIIRALDIKSIPIITKTILESQPSYRLENKKSTKEEIWFSLPGVTGEIRKQLAKKAKDIIEKWKISLRNIRHKILQDCKKFSQNDQEQQKNIIEKLTKEYNEKITKTGEQKIEQITNS